MQNNKGSYRNKIAFVKTAAKEMLALNESIAKFNSSYNKLEASFNNPKSVFDPKKLAKCVKALDKQMEYFQNKLSCQEQAFRKALAMNVPTKAIEDSVRKLSTLISKVALLKAVAETSLSSEDLLEIDENGYLVQDEAKKVDSGCGDTKKVKADDEKKEDKEEEKAPEAEGEEPKAEEDSESKDEPKAEEETEGEPEGELEAEGEELPEEESLEDKPVTQEELEEINEDVMAEIFGLTERVENMEEQLGIEPTVKASVQTNVKEASVKDNSRVQQIKLASASKKAQEPVQDVLDNIISMEIR